MSQIYVKNKLEPIEIEYERAYKIKQRKFGIDGVKKANPEDELDLGRWSGQYNQIKAIDLAIKPKKKKEEVNTYAVWLEEKNAIVKLSPEKKAKRLGKFQFDFFMLSGMTQEASEKNCKEAEKVQCEYYKKNPNAIHVPKSEFVPIVIKECGSVKPIGSITKDMSFTDEILQKRKEEPEKKEEWEEVNVAELEF